jgi:hypothetical protein
MFYVYDFYTFLLLLVKSVVDLRVLLLYYSMVSQKMADKTEVRGIFR